MNQDNYIYLDHAATTPVRQEVVESMLPYWTEFFGNPSSVHIIGQKADRGLREAREKMALLTNALPEEIIFTGSGSESDNLALRGVMWSARLLGKGNHLIVSEIEHKAVLGTAIMLRDLHNFDLTILPVDKVGRVNIDYLREVVRSDTILISIMAANNEIGTIQPLEEIGALARERGILFHSDAVQIAALRQWDFQELPVDFLTFAAHKFYGPKGLGILIARRGVDLVSTVSGGAQENGRRAGTENVAYAVGAAKAFELAMSERKDTVAHYQQLRDHLIRGILGALPDECHLSGDPHNRLANHASFVFKNISGNELLIHLDMMGVAASSGSACLVGDPKPSSVLESLGYRSDWTRGGLRLSVGRQNTLEQINYLIDILPGVIIKMRQLQSHYFSQ